MERYGLIGAVALVIVVVALLFLRRDSGARRVGGGDDEGPPRRPQRKTRANAAELASRLTEADSEAVRQLLHSGRKIDAIKLVRENTGLGLKEAKDFVERM